MTQSFFDRLDQLLPAERTATGMPSATDFLLHVMPQVIDRRADDYEAATAPVPSLPEVRILTAAGYLVDYLSVYATLATDDAVEVVYLDIDDPRRGA